MAITRLIRPLIEQNTYSEITSTTGNANTVIVSSLSITDETFQVIPGTSIPIGGGYVKIEGDNYQENLNVFFGITQVTTQYVSNTELNVSVPPLSADYYTLFIYNPDGSNAVKLRALNVQGEDSDYAWFSGGSYGHSAFTKDEPTLTTTIGYPGTVSISIANPTSTTGVYNFRDRFNSYNFDAHPSQVSTSIERLDFSNDTNLTDPRANLDTGRWKHKGTSTQSFGYWSGHNYYTKPAPYADAPLLGFEIVRTMVSSTSRMTFNNDSASISARFNLTTARSGHSVVKNVSYAWYTLGLKNSAAPIYFPSISSTERMEFSNDSASTLARGDASVERFDAGACSTQEYGWFVGGHEPYPAGPNPSGAVNLSRIDRIDFSSDTNVFLVRGDLEVDASEISTWNSPTYGWFVGGTTTDGSYEVEKSSYINPGAVGTNITESISPIARSPYNSINPSSFHIPTASLLNPRSNISRLDFTNDVVNSITRAPVANINQVATVQNQNYGWFSGGYSIDSPTSPTYFSTWRWPAGSNFNTFDDSSPVSVTFSSPNPTLITLSALCSATFGPGTSTSLRVWRAVIDYDPAITSNIERFTFASDTLTTTSRSDLILPVTSSSGIAGKI